jgi:hypothetical protein
VFAFCNDRDWLALAVATYAISFAAFAIIGFGALHNYPKASVSIERLYWLLPTLAFGFLLCPYLDLTFHRALRSASAPRSAFAVFGIAFSIMLLLTIVLWLNPNLWGRRVAAILAVGHLIAQLIFTIGAHLREVRSSTLVARDWKGIAMLALPAAGAVVLAITRLFADHPKTGEWVYLGVLGCYGLVFPAYVLIAMASGRSLNSRDEWALFVVLILISTPLYLRGFMFNETWWLLPPLALALGWFFLRRATPTRTEPT